MRFIGIKYHLNESIRVKCKATKGEIRLFKFKVKVKESSSRNRRQPLLGGVTHGHSFSLPFLFSLVLKTFCRKMLVLLA